MPRGTLVDILDPSNFRITFEVRGEDHQDIIVKARRMAGEFFSVDEESEALQVVPFTAHPHITRPDRTVQVWVADVSVKFVVPQPTVPVVQVGIPSRRSVSPDGPARRLRPVGPEIDDDNEDDVDLDDEGDYDMEDIL